ncbi:BatD family protein [Cupriavidus sp. WKF15]|uniref:BatD family protein n=1 Tax=Cupriavidus sp. WKF15 TaxID=3032282 RepID=UPI0023E2F83E|nr:BatD family protein [Cupriavidus sp. WKF15]WER45466.1 BatD family protein [Cupriavidus sp. WKF15]
MTRAGRGLGIWCTGLALWQASALALAADPLVRVEVAAQQPVLPGQQIRIEVTVLAPNFFLSAPVFPTLQVPGAIVTMPDDRGQNTVETINGASYAGIRKTYLFAAEQGGDFQLPQVSIAFTYSGDDGKPRQGSVTLPATTIRAAGAAGAPAAATLPVARLIVTQHFDRPVSGPQAHFHAGDALVRTVTTFAPQTQAMMIRPPKVEAPSGVRVFAGDPQLSDAAQDSAGNAGGSRTDRITYVFEHAGTYTLPAIKVEWFDPVTRKPGESEAPEVKVDVASAPGLAGLSPTGPHAAPLPGERGAAWRRWLWAAGGVLVLLPAWLLQRWARPRVARLRRALAARRSARAAGSEARLAVLLQACRDNDAVAAYRALGVWSHTAWGKAQSEWVAGTGNAALAAAVGELERRLFGAGASARPWSGGELARLLPEYAPAHRPVRARRATPAALPPLNP